MKKITAIISLAVLAFAAAHAAVLVEWDFNGQMEFGKEGLMATGGNVSGELSRNGVVDTVGFSANNAWGGNFLHSSGPDKETAIEKGQYFTFTLEAAEGFTMSLTAINDYTLRWSTTGPQYFQWQYSIDGTFFDDIGGPIHLHDGTGSRSAAKQSGISLVGLDGLDDTGFVVFRLVAWGGGELSSGASGNLYFDGRIGSNPHTFAIQGTTTPIPEPSSTWLLFGAGVAVVVVFRRRNKTQA